MSFCEDTKDVHYNPYKILVEGDVQIFDDPECTKYATGVKNQGDKVYARINVPWGFGEDWSVGQTKSSVLICGGPSEKYPEDTYYITLWYDMVSDDYYQPFTVGQVVELNALFGDVGDVTNYQKVFTKP